MSENKLQSPQQTRIRRILRWAGLLILGTGVVLTAIGIGSVFASSGSFRPPRFAWLPFVGMPLMFIGGVMTMLGFGAAIHRYIAGEYAPVTKDVVNYMGENIQPGVKSITKAMAEGIKEGLEEPQEPEE